MGRDMLYYTGGLCRNRKFDWAALAGIGQGLVKDLGEVSGFPGKAANIALTDSDFARLKAMENPFYLEAFTRMQDEAKAKLAAAEANARVMDTPDVPDEQLFDLYTDPSESFSVAFDKNYSDVLSSMRGLLDEWQHSTDDPVIRGGVPFPHGAKLNRQDGIDPINGDWI